MVFINIEFNNSTIFFSIYFLTLNFSMSIIIQRITLPSKPVPENSLDFSFSFFFSKKWLIFLFDFPNSQNYHNCFQNRVFFFTANFHFEKKSLECSKFFLLIQFFLFSILSDVFYQIEILVLRHSRQLKRTLNIDWNW